MTPLVSVIIPVYNCERYLAEAVESVLVQSRSPHEVIVIDDGSRDGSARVAQGFGRSVRYRFQENAGTGAARNHGASLARGDMVAFLDADDVWSEDKTARQLAAFEADPSLDIVSGQLEHFHSPELDEDLKRKIYCPPRLMPAALAGALIRREFYERVGVFETNLRVGEGLGWWMRAADAGARMLTLPDRVVRRRLHRTNQTVRNRAHLNEYARVIKAALDRRRAAG
ncbi:MAG TPA: glycosyltransferase family A protein [Pyrinomonadaceae bacterium]|jgi:glycosyltransferase involved in cell wall biosynthesis